MIDPPKRKGYRLTYDAQMYYDDWKEYGGCRCFQGNAPCSSCTHDGHPISLEENDEAWELDYTITDVYNAWKLKQEMEMSRSCITDKGSGMQPPKPQFKVGDKVKIIGNSNNHKQPVDKIVTLCNVASRNMISAEYSHLGKPWGIEEDSSITVRECDLELVVEPKKSFTMGKWYKCVESASSAGLQLNSYYKLIDSSTVSEGLRFAGSCDGCYWSKSRFDINSESDYDPNTAQPEKASPTTGYTAYVVFKSEFTVGAIPKGEYGGKEYAYKCSFEDRRQSLESLDKDVFAEVNVSGVEKKVKVVRIEAKVDPKATKSIVRILPKELAKDVEESKLGTPKAILEAVNFVHDFKPNDFSITKEDVNIMSNQNRVVSVKFFDDDAGLKAEHSLVASYEITTRANDAMTVNKLLMREDIAGDIDTHNAVRASTVDATILKNTGNRVFLQPIDFEDLRVVVSNV